MTSALALIVFYAILALHVVAAGGLERRLAQEELEAVHAAALPLAQTGLATFLVWCGLLLVVFAVPPSGWWAAACSTSAQQDDADDQRGAEPNDRPPASQESSDTP